MGERRDYIIFHNLHTLRSRPSPLTYWAAAPRQWATASTRADATAAASDDKLNMNVHEFDDSPALDALSKLPSLPLFILFLPSFLFPPL